MLLSLRIENVAVIKCADIDFSRGFTAMTGETGAGKSVILDGISLLLGAKADRELIRHGEPQASVSGLFTELSEDILNTLSECGIFADEDGAIHILRTVAADGRSAVRINGRAVSLSVLRSVTRSLVGIHGQSDTGALLDPQHHLELVDTYAKNEELLSKYRELYGELEAVRSEIEGISRKEAERERLKEILAYQISDIDALSLRDGEEEELIDRKIKIKNSEKITKNCEFVHKALRGGEKVSVYSLLSRSISALNQLCGVIPELEGRTEELTDMMYRIDDIAEVVKDQLDSLERDPEAQLNDIEARLDKISRLKRKYGLTVKDVLDFRDRAKAELDALENSEELLARLTEREEELYQRALALAETLHGVRVSSARELEARVKQTLEFLDMPKVVFYASITEQYAGERKLLNRNGCDSLEFFISANRGAEAQSISKIASGGELARIMLALKSVIADRDGITTMIFDEIDAGVSGKTARKIGIKMRELSKNAQVFCVTHSAQIASLSDTHLLISKSDVNGATETSVRPLDYEGRVTELSRILGGINVTASQREAAIDMLADNDSLLGAV
ncbi:MAG: DNA repair protein RecN [Clostridia bacterium]|nr:DNA repair protein RecN [Clostridia bacterium]